MPVYVYSCPENHRWIVVHELTARVDVVCGDCYQLMHRVPQAFRMARNPGQVLLDHMDEQYRLAKGRSLARRRNA